MGSVVSWQCHITQGSQNPEKGAGIEQIQDLILHERDLATRHGHGYSRQGPSDVAAHSFSHSFQKSLFSPHRPARLTPLTPPEGHICLSLLAFGSQWAGWACGGGERSGRDGREHVGPLRFPPIPRAPVRVPCFSLLPLESLPVWASFFSPGPLPYSHSYNS